MTPKEALEKLRNKHYFVDFELDTTVGKDCKKELDIIETALKDYEMEHTLRIRLENANYELVREKEKNDKKLKALEILKKEHAGFTFVDVYETYENYIESCSRKYNPRSKEEFDLLKEILNEKEN